MYVNITCATFKKVKCLPSNKKKRKLRQIKHQEKVRASNETKTQGNKLSETDAFALDELVKRKEAAQNKKREAARVCSARSYYANPEKKKAASKQAYHADPKKWKAYSRKAFHANPEKWRAYSRKAFHANPEKWKAYSKKHFMLIQRKKAASKRSYHANLEKWKAYSRKAFHANLEKKKLLLRNHIMLRLVNGKCISSESISLTVRTRKQTPSSFLALMHRLYFTK